VHLSFVLALVCSERKWHLMALENAYSIVEDTNPKIFGGFRTMFRFFARFARDQEGVTMVEYGLMLALIASVAMISVTLVGKNTSTVFCNAAVLLSHSGGTCASDTGGGGGGGFGGGGGGGGFGGGGGGAGGGGGGFGGGGGGGGFGGGGGGGGFGGGGGGTGGGGGGFGGGGGGGGFGGGGPFG
jgi:Flp pilus assembly pilin Flp